MFVLENKWLWLIIVLSVALVVGLSMYFGLYDAWAFFGVMFYTFVFFVFIIYLTYDNYRRISERARFQEKKMSIAYCWNKVNTELRQMTGGDGLEWDGGLGRKSELKYYGSGATKKAFRSMYGNLSNQRQAVIIIYNVEEEIISRYVANPSPDLIQDPFYKFDPFNTDRERMNMFNPYASRSRYGGRTPYRRPSYGGYGGGYQPMPQNDNYGDYDSIPNTPSKDEIAKAIDTFEGK